jgi:ABC-type transport system involved in cytochrome bd biosynthesis fused ATPase/permease subunit
LWSVAFTLFHRSTEKTLTEEKAALEQKVTQLSKGKKDISFLGAAGAAASDLEAKLAAALKAKAEADDKIAQLQRELEDCDEDLKAADKVA